METAQLIVVEGPEHHLNQVFLIHQNLTRVLGRSSVCHFRIEDPLTSSMHCQFYYEQEKFILQDLLSANGVFVNDVLVNETDLKNGDSIKVGKVKLEFSKYTGETQGKIYITGEEVDFSNNIKEIEDEDEKVAVEEASDEQTPLGRMIKKQRDLIICRLALKNRLLNHDHMQKLIAQLQSRSQKEKNTLADLIVEQDLLTKERLEKLLQEHNYYKMKNKDIQFGRNVVSQKLVSEEQIQQCLRLQERYFQETGQLPRLGELLVQKNFITVQQNNALIKAMLRHKQG